MDTWRKTLKKVQPAQETQEGRKKHCIEMAKKLIALDVCFEVVTGSVVLLPGERPAPPQQCAADCTQVTETCIHAN